jgi:exopolyphosphatase
MPNNNGPLRRLSVALRLSEAYPPTQILPPTPSSRSSLSAYLTNVKDSYLKDIKEDPKKGAGWTVVMGNEAGGIIVLFIASV